MIEYTKEELGFLVNEYLWGIPEHGRVMMEAVVVSFKSNTFMECLYPDELHYFQVPYDRVPLFINCDNNLGKLIAKWRLNICR